MDLSNLRRVQIRNVRSCQRIIPSSLYMKLGMELFGQEQAETNIFMPKADRWQQLIGKIMVLISHLLDFAEQATHFDAGQRVQNCYTYFSRTIPSFPH